MADVTTIVVNWNTACLLDGCLRSIVEATPEHVDNEVVLVDNASSDGSVELLRDRWPEVTLLVNDRNEGFCRANNRAIRATRSPVVLLVNSDARLLPGSVATVLRYFAEDPRAAAVGPRLVYADGSFQRWTAGQAFTLRTAASYLLMADRIAPDRLPGLFLPRDTAVPFRPAWVSSAVMALRRTAIEEVGLLDDDLFVYMDDVDLCHRLTARGWHVWYAADATAVHFMGASSAGAPPGTGGSAEALRALNRWFARRHGRRRANQLRVLEAVGFGCRAVAYAAAAVAGRSGSARSKLRTHLAFLRVAREPIAPGSARTGRFSVEPTGAVPTGAVPTGAVPTGVEQIDA